MLSGFYLPIALGWLALFCVYDYVLIVSFIKLRQKFGRNKIVYRLYLLASLLPLICNKLLGLSGNPDKIFMFLGISYLTFKGTQIIIEIFDGIVKNQEPLDYLYFMIFFPSITSGPIDRSRRFEEDLNNVLPRSEYLELVGRNRRCCLSCPSFRRACTRDRGPHEALRA